MRNGTEPIILAAATLLAILGAAFAQDELFRIHAWILVAILSVTTIVLLRRVEFAPAGKVIPPRDTSGYMDDVVRYGVIATIFWGVVGFLVGVLIAAQLAWPELNIQPWFNFGRLRPVHTSAVIFAFGGNALIAPVSMLYNGPAVRGCSVGHCLVRVLGLPAVHRHGGDRLSAGVTQSKEYAEPEWYVDLWLTIVWVAYLMVFMGTLVAQGAAYLCGQLVLSVFHRHRGDVASGQQRCSAGLFLGRKAIQLCRACRMR